jgi:hypothetical protein
MNSIWDGALELCLPYCIGEVSPARPWRMTEGSLYTHHDPSVSSSTRTKACCSIHLPYFAGEAKIIPFSHLELSLPYSSSHHSLSSHTAR